MLQIFTSSLKVASASTAWSPAPGGIAKTALVIRPVLISRCGGSFEKTSPILERSRPGLPLVV